MRTIEKLRGHQMTPGLGMAFFALLIITLSTAPALAQSQEDRPIRDARVLSEVRQTTMTLDVDAAPEVWSVIGEFDWNKGVARPDAALDQALCAFSKPVFQVMDLRYRKEFRIADGRAIKIEFDYLDIYGPRRASESIRLRPAGQIHGPKLYRIEVGFTF